jgi:hypothetical protein
LEKLNQEDQSSFDADALLQETLDEINQLEEANKVPLQYSLVILLLLIHLL